jgi:hypothetical protein
MMLGVHVTHMTLRHSYVVKKLVPFHHSFFVLFFSFEIMANKNLQDLLGVLVCVCHPSYTRSINRRITVQACPGINAKPYQK